MPKSKITKHNYVTFTDDYILELKRCLDKLDRRQIGRALDLLVQAYSNKRTIFIMGNGGSASNASHMACDLGKGTLQRHYDETESRVKVVSLTDNVAILTAFANDISFEDIFMQQLRNLVMKDDVIIAMSGSGNSKNVIKAVSYAKRCGAKTIGFLGFKTGGRLANMVDCAIVVNSMHYGPCEDIQLVLDHIMTSWIAKLKSLHDGLENIPQENKAVPFKVYEPKKSISRK